MNKFLTMLFAIMLVLSGCLGGEDVSGNEEPQPVLLDTDGDGIPDVEDEDDDGDSWSDIDELNCDSDSLLASSVPADANGDGICDIRDLDDDGDSFADAVENQCGSDPLDATSVPADLDADGTCDALDDDIDGDGVANADDFAPEDPEKSEGVSGCTDATAFNYDETAEVDDASCFTLADAEEAVVTAMAGIVSMQSTQTMEGVIIQTTANGDFQEDKNSLTIAVLGEDGEVAYQGTYTYDGSEFVEVELYYIADESESDSWASVTENYKVDSAYYMGLMGESGWSHCEQSEVTGTWYCTDIFIMGEMLYNSDSETETYHLYTCANGDTVLLSQVNDGTEDCADASDEPNVQDDGSMFMCNDGSTIDFHLANDGSVDCADGSDEDNFIDEFTCPDGPVLPGYYINDGYEDCADGSDEPEYNMDQYETSTYTCEDGTTVPLSDVNDDVEDCPDGTDENPPDGDITELFEFICGGESFWDDQEDDSDAEIIPLSMVNDGNEDCDDGSDEPAYDENGAETNYYACYNIETDSTSDLNISKVNDGAIDCDLRMDESAAAGNYTERWFGWGDETEEYTGECQMDGDDFEIPWSWVNDGIDDCDNGMDEPSYDITGAEDSVITCYDDTEIALSLANDGTDDCAEGEDETTWDLLSTYTCADGDSVDFEWLNDGEEDCNDGSDEPTYELEELTDFECDDGTLIPFSYVNDGSDDCTNAEDEPDYQETEYTTFECASGDEIPLSYVNNGEEDCPTGDDEPSYDPITQNEVSTYTCLYSGESIALSLVNDGGDDCEDSSDEPDYYEEDLNEMECADGSDTIPIEWANDGYENCMDGSDEAQYEMPEDESVFYCADGSQITVSQYNDGAVDCADGSDEPTTFECDDGSNEIPFGYVNDGYDDCYDGSDESLIEDLSVADCYGSEDGITVTASQFHDGQNDCASDWENGDFDWEDSWDEMEFEMVSDCEWTGDDTGWMCDDVNFPTGGSYEMWMHTDENGLEIIGLNATMTDGTVFSALFDAATHAFLMMEETVYNEDGDLEEYILKSILYDSTIADALVVDTSLNTHAPAFAVLFDGQPMSLEDDRTYLCDDETESVDFSAVNDGVEDCSDASDEPSYEYVEDSYFYCSADEVYIYLSQVNDGAADCSDSEDEDDGTGTQTYYCESEEMSDETGQNDGLIPFSKVNDGYVDCLDSEDEPVYYVDEISDFPCEDGEDNIPLSWVNDGHIYCMDGSDEAPQGEGHGYGEYEFASFLEIWAMGTDDDMLEIVFTMCDSFDLVESQLGDDYLLPSDCGDELARYTMDELLNGDVVGVELYTSDEPGMGEEYVLYVDESFELDGWNTVRLSTPSGEYTDENPEIQLPAPGIGFAILAMLGAAMMAGRRNE
ncbi:hypothetical protein N8996_05910 [Candidatus Poseidonia alphae]|nr:hypothetical protein [Candidatus Poseidonia alphae]